MLVPVDGARVDAARGAGLACDACGATTWLRDLAAGDDVVDAETTARAAPASQPALTAGAALAPVRAGGPVDLTARVDVDKLAPATDTQAALDASFRQLLSRWHDDAAHKAFLALASSTGELAFAGQRYKAVLEAVPGDEKAKKAQGDILVLAMAALGNAKDAGVPGTGKTRTTLTVVAAALLVAALVALAWVVFGYGDLAAIDAPAAPPP